jgi:hypothetical protein
VDVAEAEAEKVDIVVGVVVVVVVVVEEEEASVLMAIEAEVGEEDTRKVDNLIAIITIMKVGIFITTNIINKAIWAMEQSRIG